MALGRNSQKIATRTMSTWTWRVARSSTWSHVDLVVVYRDGDHRDWGPARRVYLPWWDRPCRGGTGVSRAGWAGLRNTTMPVS